MPFWAPKLGEKTLSSASMQNQKTEFGAAITTRKWELTNARKENNTQEKPQILYKLHPNP